MSSSLAALVRTDCNADLYISTIREEDQGGLSLLPKLVATVASCDLLIQISILVMLDDYAEPEQESSLSNTADILQLRQEPDLVQQRVIKILKNYQEKPILFGKNIIQLSRGDGNCSVWQGYKTI